jgi:hypothetical protein
MPKAVGTLDDFTGGMNTDSSPKDIAPNELTVCENADPNSKGKITAGRIVSSGFSAASGSTAPTTGKGLIIFTNDNKISDNNSGFTGQFIVKNDGTNIDILETTDGTTGTWTEDVMTGVSSKPCYYVADGDLYVGGEHSIPPKCLRFYQRSDFPGTDETRAVGDWKVETQEKAIPTANDMVAVWADQNGDVPAADNPAMIADEIKWVLGWGDAASGRWTNDADGGNNIGKIEVAGTWLYKEKAESGMFNLGIADYDGANLDDGHDVEDRALKVQCWVDVLGAHTASTANRTGARLYVKKSKSSTWYLLAEVDFEKGILGDGEIDWNPWEDNADSSKYEDLTAGGTGTEHPPQLLCETQWIESQPETFTFDVINGYMESSIPTSNIAYFKAACVANARAYIGNVKINGRVYPDRILKSPPYQYDVFTEDMSIEFANQADGDEIVALHTFGDRILVFKRTKLVVLNVSDVAEVVESESNGYGVANSGAVISTPDGVLWANTNGAYMFTGEDVVDLNYKNEVGIRLKDSDWDSMSDNAIVGYDPKSKEAYFVWDASSSGGGNAFVYSFRTQAWYRQTDLLSQDVNSSNFALGRFNKLYIHGDTNIQKVRMLKTRADASANPTIDIRTADLTLENLMSTKNLCSISVTYKGGSSTNLTLAGAVNSQSTYYSIGTLDDTSGDFVTETFDVATTGTWQGKVSYSFKISGVANAAFEIQDINISYRDLGVR